MGDKQRSNGCATEPGNNTLHYDSKPTDDNDVKRTRVASESSMSFKVYYIHSLIKNLILIYEFISYHITYVSTLFGSHRIFICLSRPLCGMLLRIGTMYRFGA